MQTWYHIVSHLVDYSHIISPQGGHPHIALFNYHGLRQRPIGHNHDEIFVLMVALIKDQWNPEGLRYGLSRDVKSLVVSIVLPNKNHILFSSIVDIEVNNIVGIVEVILGLPQCIPIPLDEVLEKVGRSILRSEERQY